MTPSERVASVANAISDGMNCIAHLQSLRAAPPTAVAEDLEAWRETLAQCNRALEITRSGTLDDLPLSASWQPSDKLGPMIESVRSCLTAITPGIALPPALFDLADVVWAEFTKNEEDQTREQMAEQMSDFYAGAAMLEKLADWAYVVANQRTVLEHLASFEAAYEQLAKLHAAGELSAGAADFSEENLERVKRIVRLVQAGLDSSEANHAALEVQALVGRCLQGLTRSKPMSSG